MIKRLLDGMQVWAPESGIDNEGPGIGGHPGPKGRVRETESGATIGNINPGELSDSIDMSGRGGGGGGEVIDRGPASLIEGGGESDVTATPEHGGAIGGGPGGSQTDAAGPSGGGSAR